MDLAFSKHYFGLIYELYLPKFNMYLAKLLFSKHYFGPIYENNIIKVCKINWLIITNTDS